MAVKPIPIRHDDIDEGFLKLLALGGDVFSALRTIHEDLTILVRNQRRLEGRVEELERRK